MNHPTGFALFQPGKGRAYNEDDHSSGELSGWMSIVWNILTTVTGLSVFGSIFSGMQPQGLESAGLKVLPMLLLGLMIEVGRRLSLWFFNRFRFRKSVDNFGFTSTPQ
jgi:hypothetical protein